MKQNPLKRSDQDDFLAAFLPGSPRSERRESERWHSFTFEELTARDKANLDITWLKDDSLSDLENLLVPEVIARQIIDDLTAALAQFEVIAEVLKRPA